MRAAGIAVKMARRGRPVVRLAVVISNAPESPVIETLQDFTGDDVDTATQLHDLAEAVQSRLDGLGVDRAVVRRADRPERPSNQEGPRQRLLTEGALTSAAKSVVVDTRIGTGKDIGSWFGEDKAAVEAAAATMLRNHQLDAKYVEAVSAALAGLKIT